MMNFDNILKGSALFLSIFKNDAQFLGGCVFSATFLQIPFASLFVSCSYFQTILIVRIKKKFNASHLWQFCLFNWKNSFSSHSGKVFPFSGFIIFTSIGHSNIIAATSGSNFVDVDRDTRHASIHDFFPPCMSLSLEIEGVASLAL